MNIEAKREGRLQTLMNAHAVVGASMAVVHNGQIEVTAAGKSDVISSPPVDPCGIRRSVADQAIDLVCGPAARKDRCPQSG